MNEDYLEKETSQIVLLGTGTPYADPLRCGSSVAIVVNQIPYIVDFIHRFLQHVLPKGFVKIRYYELTLLFKGHGSGGLPASCCRYFLSFYLPGRSVYLVGGILLWYDLNFILLVSALMTFPGRYICSP